MQADEYLTIIGESRGIYKEKGSKFLAFAYPVSDEETAKKHIQRLRREYFDARHCCFAWRLGLDDNAFRTNDDGEPSGTAGKPIYGQIMPNELTNILIVVVRYFGGVKLGTSGLINAYRTAAADAISAAQTIVKTANDYYSITFSYDAMNDVQRVIKEETPEIISQQFDLQCQICFSVRKLRTEKIIDKLSKISSVQISETQAPASAI